MHAKSDAVKTRGFGIETKNGDKKELKARNTEQ